MNSLVDPGKEKKGQREEMLLKAYPQKGSNFLVCYN